MRDLGVIVDSKLNFTEHIDSVVKHGNRALGLLIRSLQGVRGSYCRGGVIAAYCANVRSILEYGSIIWAGAACSHLEMLERIQHKFLAFLAGTIGVIVLTWLIMMACVYRIGWTPTSLGSAARPQICLFLHGVLRGKIESSLLLSQFSLHVAARRTGNSEFLFVPSCRIMASMSALFARLLRSFNSFFTVSSIFWLILWFQNDHAPSLLLCRLSVLYTVLLLFV